MVLIHTARGVIVLTQPVQVELNLVQELALVLVLVQEPVQHLTAQLIQRA